MNKKDVAKKMKHEPTLIEHGVPRSTVDYMRKHKQGIFSKADKKLVKDNQYSGKASLNRASGRNEGDKMTLGKNENNRF